MEAFSPLYAKATEFLIAIADPVSRPGLMHEFKITTSSLLTAVSLQYASNKILDELNQFSKNKDLPFEVIRFIKENTEDYGKAKCVLYENRYFIESEDDKVFNKICSLPKVNEYFKKAKLRGESLKVEKDVSINGKDEPIQDVFERESLEITEYLERCFISDERKKMQSAKLINRLEFSEVKL